MSRFSLSRRPVLRRLQILVLAGLAWLLLAELAYRGWRAIRGRPYSAAWAETQLDALVGQLRGSNFVPQSAKSAPDAADLTLHPYLGFEGVEFTRSGAELVRYFASPEAKANFDIVLTGGSVACGFGNWSAQYLLPAIQADPRLAGRQVRLHNLACPGHKQPQHVITLEWLLAQGCMPDALILLDGFNEIAVAAENARVGVHPLFPYWAETQIRMAGAFDDPEDLRLLGRAVAARDEAEELGARLRGLRLRWSALAGTWEVHQLEGSVRRARGQMLALQQHQAARKSNGAHSVSVGGPGFDKDPQAVQRQSIEAWREGSLSMAASCRERGIFFLHVLQPSPCDRDSKPLTPDELHGLRLAPLWDASIAKGYPVLREVGAELRRRGVNFFDATQVFAGHSERIYVDCCHFEEAGCAILGPRVAEAFLKAWKP
jgi:hypothetical protein